MKNILKEIFPRNLLETGILAFFILCYSTLAYDIATNYAIMYNMEQLGDIYFGFDVTDTIISGGEKWVHPFTGYLFYFVRIIADFISGGNMPMYKFLLAMTSTLSISLGLLQIFKYLRNIIELPVKLSIFLVLFTGVFSTNIILSFTPETHTLSFFILSLFCYYSSLKIKNKELFNVIELTFFTFGIGGITITNIVKTYMPLLFEKPFLSRKKIISVLLVGGAFFLIFLLRMKGDILFFYKANQGLYKTYSNLETLSKWDAIISLFLGGNLILPQLIEGEVLQNGIKAINMTAFESIYQYLVILLFFCLIIWSIFKNYKNQFVLLLLSILAVDITIHIILGFGLQEGYIYGGNFVFIYPMLIGWLFQKQKYNALIFNILLGIIFLLFSFFIFNNFTKMQDFYNFIDLYYRV